MATIIALSGGCKTGKTSVLIELINRFPRKDVTYEQDLVDKIVVMAYKNNTENTKKIGIATCGDDRKALEKAFDKMGVCDIYVCACRTKGETIDFLKEKENKGDSILLIGRWLVETLQSKENKDSQNIATELQCIRNDYNKLQADKLYTLVISKL